MHHLRVKNSFVHARARQLDHFIDSRRGNCRPPSKTRDLFFTLDVARIARHVRGILKSRIGQPLQDLDIRTVVDYSVKRATVGVESAPYAGNADARPLHPGIE